jgi:Cytochrome P450
MMRNFTDSRRNLVAYSSSWLAGGENGMQQGERAASNSRQVPPEPRGFPVLGHLPFIGRDVLGFFTTCARQYGDVVALRLGQWPALLLSHPDYIETVLVKNHRSLRTASSGDM